MRSLFLACLLVLVCACTSHAGIFFNRGGACANGQCSSPPSASVLAPTAAKTCAPDCQCPAGKCTCGPNCPAGGGSRGSCDSCDGNRSGFMSRGPVRRGVRGVFGRLFGCRGC